MKIEKITLIKNMSEITLLKKWMDYTFKKNCKMDVWFCLLCLHFTASQIEVNISFSEEGFI